MNSVLFQDILNRTREIPQEMASEVEDNWRQNFRILVENNGQNFFKQIVEYLKQCKKIESIQQARWERFLARTLLLMNELPTDIRELAVRVYFSAGIYLAAAPMRNEVEKLGEDSFFSGLYKAKQLAEKNEVEKSELELEKVKNEFPNMQGAIELGKKVGIFGWPEKPKIALFVKPKMDSFLGDIIECLKNDYDVKKCIVTESKQIEEGMAWADICWFEWCDELIIYGSQLEAAKRKKMICRLHSYEAFTEYPKQVKWNVVDKVIFVAEHIREFVLENVSVLKKEQTLIIPNGIDLEKYTYKERKPGFNIAYVGYINYKKGPMLLLHTFKAIYDTDKRYKLFIAGQFQDPRDVLYFKQMIKEWKMEKNVIFQGWQNDLNTWLEDKNYILCTSLLESQNMSVMQAMAKGIKPLIHNFVGARKIYPNEYIWNTCNEVVEKVQKKQYESRKYRAFIEANYSNTNQLELIMPVFASELTANSSIKKNQLVTIGITNYNAQKYVIECLNSVFQQSYKNLEVIIVDDLSTDQSYNEIIKYVRNKKNITLIQHKENSGSPDLARREIIELAKGKYFMLVDSDDFFTERDAVERLVESIESLETVDYVYCVLAVVDEKSEKINQWDYMPYDANTVVRKTFRSGGSGVLNMKGLFRTEFFRANEISYLSNGTAGDTLTALLCMKKNMTMRYVQEPLLSYRQHQNNFTFDVKKRIESVSNILEYIIENFSETIYFSDYDWNGLTEEERKTNKYYFIASLYFEVFKQYYEGKWKPWENKDDFSKSGEIATYSVLLRDLSLHYIYKTTEFTEIYKNNILEMEEYFSNIYGSLAISREKSIKLD